MSQPSQSDEALARRLQAELDVENHRPQTESDEELARRLQNEILEMEREEAAQDAYRSRHGHGREGVRAEGGGRIVVEVFEAAGLRDMAWIASMSPYVTMIIGRAVRRTHVAHDAGAWTVH